MSATLQRWALACGAAAVTGVLAWLAWSWCDAPAPRAGFVAAEAKGFMLQPHANWRHVTPEFDVLVTTNTLGLRGPEVTLPKPAGVYRILVLGDSFSFGWGVELAQAWPTLLGPRLRRSDGRRVEVLNAGVPGWCPLQEFVFLERQGLALEPDLVLLQLCSNDLREMETLQARFDARRLPESVRPFAPMVDGPPPEWVVELERMEGTDVERVLSDFRRGRLDPAIHKASEQAVESRRRAAGPPPEGAIAELSSDELVRGLASGHDFGVAYLDFMVAAMRAACVAQGARLRVVLIDTGLADRRVRTGDRAPDDGTRALRAWAGRQDPTVLDMVTTLPADRLDEMFFKVDPHWVPAAHALAAPAVARWLSADASLGLSLVAGR